MNLLRKLLSSLLVVLLMFSSCIDLTNGALGLITHAETLTSNLDQNQGGSGKKIVREVFEKRTNNSKHYLLEDGSYQAVITLHDQHYEDESGHWQDIKPELVDEADLHTLNVPLSKEVAEQVKQIAADNQIKRQNNTLDKSQTSFRALQVPFDVVLPKQFEKGYSVAKGKDKITFIPNGTNQSIAEGTSNDEIKYADAWTDAHVSLKLLDIGIKETITLKTSQAPTKFTFEVDGNLADDLTAGQLKLQSAWLQDANGTKRDVAQTVRRDVTTGKTYIDLVADVADLVYPIVIDPTVTIQPEIRKREHL